jgi:hypothetical protein
MFDWLRAGRSWNRIQVGMRFFAHVQTGPGDHPASCTMGTGSFPGANGQGVVLTTHPFYRRGHERVELYLYPPSRPVQACNGTALPLPFKKKCYYLVVNWTALLAARTREDNIKIYLKETGAEGEKYLSIGAGGASSYQRSNEPSVFTKCGIFLDWQRNCQLIWMDCASCSSIAWIRSI